MYFAVLPCIWKNSITSGSLDLLQKSLRPHPQPLPLPRGGERLLYSNAGWGSLFLIYARGLVKAEVATGCAKHGNVKAEVATVKAGAATGCAKHGNVKAEVTTVKAEVATGCAKHGNVKAEVATVKAEAATGCAKHGNVKAEVATVSLQ